MSGVYIKGMGMPSECLYCPCYDLGRELCNINRKRQYCHAKPSDCPLIPVPDHGRLIDADAADNYAYDELAISPGYRTSYEASRNMQKIYLAMPTIIPADKEA